MHRPMTRYLWLLLGTAALAACERKPAAPGEAVYASNQAVLQCSADTDCMINRVCSNGQCTVHSDSGVMSGKNPLSQADAATARLAAESSCLAYAKAYMNSAVSAGMSDMSIPAHSGSECLAPTTALTLQQIQSGAIIEFVPKVPGVMRIHCNAASAICSLTQSDSEWLSNQGAADSDPAGADAAIDITQSDDAAAMEAEALAIEQERSRLERERVAAEKQRLERERRELERQRERIAAQRAAEREIREQEVAAQQATTADAIYEGRRSECRKGFIGSACRKRIRDQVCDEHWSQAPPPGNSICKLK